MRIAALTIVGWLSVNMAFAQVSPSRSLEPSILEAFATRPDARVTWSKVIGNLESKESRATITTFIVEDTSSKPKVMRGIKINLTHLESTPRCNWKYQAWTIMCQRANAAVYIDESELPSVRDGLKWHAVELRPMEFISTYEVKSAGRTARGLIVCGYQFSGRTTSDLAELLRRAINELKTAPR